MDDPEHDAKRVADLHVVVIMCNKLSVMEHCWVRDTYLHASKQQLQKPLLGNVGLH